MRDFTLRFSDKADFRAFLRNLTGKRTKSCRMPFWLMRLVLRSGRQMFLMTENQNTRETKGTLLISVFLTMDLMIPCSVSGWLHQSARSGVVLRIADGYHADTSCNLCCGGTGAGWSLPVTGLMVQPLPVRFLRPRTYPGRISLD